MWFRTPGEVGGGSRVERTETGRREVGATGERQGTSGVRDRVGTGNGATEGDGPSGSQGTGYL